MTAQPAQKVINLDELRGTSSELNSKKQAPAPPENEGDPFAIDIDLNSNPVTPALQRATKFLDELGIFYEIKTQYHIRITGKYNAVNYYPKTGSCYIDRAQGKFKRKGLDFLKLVLQKEGYL